LYLSPNMDHVVSGCGSGGLGELRQVGASPYIANLQMHLSRSPSGPGCQGGGEGRGNLTLSQLHFFFCLFIETCIHHHIWIGCVFCPCRGLADGGVGLRFAFAVELCQSGLCLNRIERRWGWEWKEREGSVGGDVSI
jgi:hypothetical protein